MNSTATTLHHEHYRTHCRTQETLIRLVFATTLLCLVLVRGAGAGERLTPRQFAKCQEAYCEQLVATLNQPIEWRLVLDVSGSFGPSPEDNIRKVLAVTRDLPLSIGDTFCLDSFDLTYYKDGDCFEIQSRQDINALRSPHEFLRSEIDNVRVGTREKTDILATLEEVAQSMSSCEDRRYFVFITDGEQDPLNSPETELLFSSNGSIAFDGRLFDFVQPGATNGSCADRGQLVRGLHFVIDALVAKEEVVRDWRMGQRLLRSSGRKHVQSSNYRVFSPAITILAFGDDDASFSQGIREAVDRAEGIVPCLYSLDPEMKGPHRWPTLHVRGSGLEIDDERCSGWPQDKYNLYLPPMLLASDAQGSKLEIRLLAYGTGSASLRTHLSSNSREEEFTVSTGFVPSWSDQRDFSPPSSSDSTWRQYPMEVPLAINFRKVNGLNLPVEGRLELGHLAGASDFLEISIDGPDPIAFEFTKYFLETRGWLAIICGLFFLAVSIVLLAFAARNPGTLRVEKNEETGSGDDDKTKELGIRNTFLRNNGFRARLDREGNLLDLDDFRPYTSPDFEKDEELFEEDKDHCRLDIILLGFLIYFVVWRRSRNPLPDPDDRFALDIIDDKARAKLVTPRTTWIPVPDGNILWSRWLKWGRDLKIQIGPGKIVEYSIYLILKAKTRWFRTAALFFHAMAAAAAAVAVRQFLAGSEPVGIASTLGKIAEYGAWFLVLRIVMYVALHLSQWKWLSYLYFATNRLYIVAFSMLMCSAIVLAFSPGGQTSVLLVLGVFLVFFGGMTFLFRHWVRKRIQEGKSFHLTDILLDTFLSYGPLAS